MRDRLLRDTPVSVIDFETTGLSARGGARVVEVAVARVDPGEEPRIVFDTLIDPEGPVLCTSIHGITDDDVLGAPRFTDIVGELVLSLDGSVVGAFNASFDMSFLAAETKLARRTAGLRLPPHICLMWLRPLTGLSKRCSLDDACSQHGLRAGTHRAAEDALACAYMWRHYVDAAEQSGWRTWGQLASAGSHKYLDSLESRPYSRNDFVSVGGEPSRIAKKPRRAPVASPVIEERSAPNLSATTPQTRSYWNGLIDALADGKIDENELAALAQLQRDLSVSESTLRDAHARLFAESLRLCAEDGVITDAEVRKLRDLRQSLHALGWAPG